MAKIKYNKSNGGSYLWANVGFFDISIEPLVALDPRQGYWYSVKINDLNHVTALFCGGSASLIGAKKKIEEWIELEINRMINDAGMSDILDGG